MIYDWFTTKNQERQKMLKQLDWEFYGQWEDYDNRLDVNRALSTLNKNTIRLEISRSKTLGDREGNGEIWETSHPSEGEKLPYRRRGKIVFRGNVRYPWRGRYKKG